MSQSSPEVPAAPDPAETYRRGIETNLEFAPQLMAAERALRGQYDPLRIEEQQGLESIYGPRQREQQLGALNQLDPQSQAIRGELGQRVLGDLNQGYNLPDDLDTQLTGQIRGAQAARGNSLGTGAGNAEALFKGGAAIDLYNRRQANAGTFLSSPTPIQQISGIQAVQPDRGMSYVNPNAGYQGQNFGLQNYGNQVAAWNATANQSNPWAGALSGAASGAMIGGAGGNPYGAAIGGVVGGAAGYFSDERIKENIIEQGTSPDGHAIVRFNYIGIPGQVFEGVIAQDIQETCPEAVFERHGLLVVNYDLLDVEFKEVTA